MYKIIDSAFRVGGGRGGHSIVSMEGMRSVAPPPSHSLWGGLGPGGPTKARPGPRPGPHKAKQGPAGPPRVPQGGHRGGRVGGARRGWPTDPTSPFSQVVEHPRSRLSPHEHIYV